MADVFFDQDEEAPVGGPPPDEPRRIGRWLMVLAVLGLLVLLVIGAGFVYVQGKIDPGGDPGEEVAFVIESGSTTTDVADELASEGIISDATVFRLWLRVKGGESFDAGTYTLRRNSSFDEVVATLDEGPALPPADFVTFPEGLTVRKTIERVGTFEGFDAAVFEQLIQGGQLRSKYQPEGAPLEGFLYPETYRIEEGDDEVSLLEAMIGTFDQVADSVGLADAEAAVGVSPYEAVIVASLIEAETRLDEERGKIARVIYNRLEQGIPLGIDATFYFAIPEREGKGLRQSDLEIDSPYNTRTNQGLVPTPIAMPRRASLEAALNPEEGPWLYYVLQDETSHFFTDDYDEFINAKNRAEANGLIPG